VINNIKGLKPIVEETIKDLYPKAEDITILNAKKELDWNVNIGFKVGGKQDTKNIKITVEGEVVAIA
jgi:hypothetical protein